MAKTNFQFERRQKDLEKKRKKDEKLKRKADKKDVPGEEGAEGADGADGAEAGESGAIAEESSADATPPAAHGAGAPTDSK